MIAILCLARRDRDAMRGLVFASLALKSQWGCPALRLPEHLKQRHAGVVLMERLYLYDTTLHGQQTKACSFRQQKTR
jgi:hypothetical protein